MKQIDMSISQLTEAIKKVIFESSDYMTPDDRIWRVFDENNDPIGLFSYSAILNLGHEPVLNPALYNIKKSGYRYEIIGRLYPLEEKSKDPELQALKDKFIRKNAAKHGYRLNSTLKFGKYKGIRTIKDVIDNDRPYMNWLIDKTAILLHPEVTQYLGHK